MIGRYNRKQKDIRDKKWMGPDKKSKIYEMSKVSKERNVQQK